MSEQVFLWLIASINCLVTGLLVYTIARFPAGPIRTSFAAVLIATLFYANPLLIFWHPGLSPDERLMLARISFGTSLILLNGLTFFTLYFCERGDEIRSWRFAVYQIAWLTFFALNFFGFVAHGIEGSERIVYGLAHKPLVVFFFLSIGYWGYIGAGAYRSSTDVSFRFQMKIVLMLSVSTCAAMVFNNGVIPAITGSSRQSPFSVVLLILYFGGLAALITQGLQLELFARLQALLRLPEFEFAESRIALRQYLGNLQFFLEEKPESAIKTARFQTNRGHVSVAISVGDSAIEEGSQRRLPAVLLRTMEQTIGQLQSENLRLSLAVDSARSILFELQRKDPEVSSLIDQLLPNKNLLPGATNLLTDGESDAPADLTPLELSERKTNIDHLQKNGFNQRKTSQDLGIRPNTLIVKMRKYEIKVPLMKRPGRKPGYSPQNPKPPR